MGPLQYKKNETQKKSSFPRHLFQYNFLILSYTDLRKILCFCFLSPIAVGHSVLPTKMTYGNLFVFVFLEAHSGWPNRGETKKWRTFILQKQKQKNTEQGA